MRAMIMAAGLGTRLMPLTDALPKPMVPIVGRPALGHILDLLRGHGVTEVVVNLHHFPDTIRDRFGDGAGDGMSIRYSFEPELMGTAGGVKNNQAFLETGPFLVLSGDSLTDVDLTALVAAHRGNGGVATLATARVADTSLYGVVVTDEGRRILGFQEKPAPEEALSDLCNCGIYVFEPEIFDHIPAAAFYDFGKQVFPGLLADGRPFHAHTIDGYWNDVGSVGSYREGNFDALVGRVRVAHRGSLLRSEGAAPSDGVRVGEGVRVGPGARLEGHLFLDDGCVIEDGATILGPSILGKGSVVGSAARVEGSILWDGCVVREDALVEQSVLADDVECGAGARLRGVVAGRACRVGAGRDISDATLEPGTRIQ